MTSRPVHPIGQLLYLHLTTYLKSTKMAYYILGAVTLCKLSSWPTKPSIFCNGIPLLLI